MVDLATDHLSVPWSSCLLCTSHASLPLCLCSALASSWRTSPPLHLHVLTVDLCVTAQAKCPIPWSPPTFAHLPLSARHHLSFQPQDLLSSLILIYIIICFVQRNGCFPALEFTSRGNPFNKVHIRFKICKFKNIDSWPDQNDLTCDMVPLTSCVAEGKSLCLSSVSPSLEQGQLSLPHRLL